MKIKISGLVLSIVIFSFGCATGVSNSGASQEWASINGYYSAQFGMNEEEVYKAIKNDFGIGKNQISRKIHPNEKTVTLGIQVSRLLPGSGTAKVFYILGYKSKRLIHINVIWGKPVTKNPNAEAVVDTANQLRNHFALKKYQKAGFAINAQLDDEVILVFQGKDRKGRAARLLLSNPKSDDDKKAGENIALTLSYIEKPEDPDVFRVGEKWMPPKQSFPEEEHKKQEDRRLAEEKRKQQPHEEQSPQSGTGSGFFVSKMGHVITNAHVVNGCNRVTVGDNANKQVSAEVINTDSSNDLALLKLSSLEMTSADSKSLIQKLSIVVVPLASKGLLRSEDVRLGEKVLVAGYPFGDIFSNTIKVTTGVVSATRGAGDDSGQFQLDAAVQPGNSGGPIYDSGGNIVGVVISQLDKLKVAKAIGSLPENVNFGIKASTVRQFLISSGLPSKKAEQTEEKSTEQLAEIAQNQALMVMCLQ